jgi:hypothetical protein
MGLTVTPHRLAGWTPASVELENGDDPVVRWYYTEGVDFIDPFFDQTIERCLQDPFRLLFWRETGMGEVTEFASASPGLAPSGFIFHLSRCGSTLLAQMLAGLDQALIMSEPPVIDQVLRARNGFPGLSAGEQIEWLRAMCSALGQRRHPEQKRFVVKLDAWAILQWPLIREAFPTVPCVFLYRDPLEVLVSHLSRRGAHMIPGSLAQELTGLDALSPDFGNAEEFSAEVLRLQCEAGLEAARRGDVRLINYTSLVVAASETIAPLFGFDPEPGLAERFGRVAEREAKNPLVPFSSDTVEKERRATAEARAAVEARVRPWYDALERRRREVW